MSAGETFFLYAREKKNKIKTKLAYGIPKNELIRVYVLRATIRFEFFRELRVEVFGHHNFQLSHSFLLPRQLTLCFVKHKRRK